MNTKSETEDQLESSGDNVEQIREILFGGHIRAFDERFDLVESRLSRESATLRKTLEKQIANLERKLAEYQDEAKDQLGTETNNRDLALNKIEVALATARMDAENQMAQMQDSLSADIKAVREELKKAQEDSSKALSELEKLLDKRSNKLDEDKVNRKDLSRFFNDIAEKIQPAKTRRNK